MDENEIEQTMDDQDDQSVWSIIQLFGHQTLAGKISRAQGLFDGFLLLDVPQVGEYGGFQRILSPDVIFSVQFCTEEEACAAVRRLYLNRLPNWLMQPKISVTQFTDIEEE